MQAVKESVMKYVFSFTLWQSLILVKFQAFVIYGSERFCDGVSEGVRLW